MKIKVSEIKEFFRRARSIKNSSLLPILNYLKLESKDGEATLSKTNEKSYCIHQIECDDEGIFLLNESKLLAAINNPQCGEEITIEERGTQLRLLSGRVDLSFAKADEKLYPAFPSYGENKTVSVLPKPVIESIAVAKNFVFNVPGATHNQYSYLHVNKAVYSTNGVVMYYKPFEEELPTLVLDDEACNTIIQHESLQHFTGGNYDFFDTGKTIYGFIKPEFTSFDMSNLIKSLTKEQFFEISKEDFVSFCDIVNDSTNEKTPISKFENGKANTLTFSCNEDGGNAKMEFPIEANFHPEAFGFNTKLIQPFLKSLPYQKLKFSPGNNRYTIRTIFNIIIRYSFA